MFNWIIVQRNPLLILKIEERAKSIGKELLKRNRINKEHCNEGKEREGP